MQTPDFKAVFQDPDAHRAFLCVEDDGKIEGQHFDRKQAGEVNETGEAITNSGFDRVQKLVEKTMSGFANASGGLLIIGISKTGETIGIDHLSEDQRGNLCKVASLKGARIEAKIHAFTVEDQTRHVALLVVENYPSTFCTRAKDGAAWLRKGTSTVELKGEELEQFKRDRKVVDFERRSSDAFELDDVDSGVLTEFKTSCGYGADRDAEDVLRGAGALTGRNSDRYWTHAGLLFFATNPDRCLPQAFIRLLRFDCLLEASDERPTPSFDQDFRGSLTKQIRDFRTFAKESAFFRTYEVRAPDGGFVSEPEYPAIAVDEAVVNAVAHRDYGLTGPIVCEKYQDAFVVRSPGRLKQQISVPDRFTLREQTLESDLRNPMLMNWLRSMRDAQGTPYVKAIQEGTRRMRDEMERLGLPSPLYESKPLETCVVLRNDHERRKPKPTGLAAQEDVEAPEYTNLYPVLGLKNEGGRDGEREERRAFMQAMADKLEASDWVIAKQSKGRLVAHLKGAQDRLDQRLSKTVRLVPAYSFSLRGFFGRTYLSVDFTLEVRSLLTIEKALESFDQTALIGLGAFAIIDDRPVRGRITSLEDGQAMVRIFETDDDESLPYMKVFPNLRREQLNRLIHERAPGFDFSRAIKKAALSSMAGAARVRALKIETIVQTLERDVFPLSVKGRDVEISDEPLRAHRQGDGKRALLVDAVTEPDVAFSQDRKTADIRQGITSYGSYQHEPKDVEIVAVVERGWEEPLRQLVGRLQSGKYKYKGSEQTFATRLKLGQIAVPSDLSADQECARLIEQSPEWRGDERLSRIFLVHTPESGFALDDVGSPYYRAKRVLLEAGIPSQMMDTPTLRNPDYKDLNLALNLVAKTGLTPWVLPQSIPDADFFVGLSYSQSREGGAASRVLGFANVFSEYGRWEFYSGGNEAVPFEERSAHYERLVADTLGKLSLSQAPTIYFHYSAKFSRQDRDAILRGARAVRPDGRYVFVWINTGHPVRLFDERGETDGSIARGRYVVSAPNQIFLSTTGYNEYRKTIGTPQALEVNVYAEQGSSGIFQAIDHRALARQILCLTKLNWASTDALCGEPITTKYAKDIAYLTAAFQRQGKGAFQLHPVLERTPWFI
ncbi:MAG: RNA-binding domain-containing protein [Pseudomonadota bacterium]